MNQILSAARISKENHRKLNSEKEKNITKNTLYSLAVVLREAKIKVIFLMTLSLRPSPPPLSSLMALRTFYFLCLQICFLKERHTKTESFLVVGPLRGEGGVKPPTPLSKKNIFISMI